MKKKIYYLATLLLVTYLFVGFSSCADDLGNYHYTDIPEVSIEGIENSITALAYQPLAISVELQGMAPGVDRYEYEWKTIRRFDAEDDDELQEQVIANTKDLDEVIALAPGAYKLVYTVRDKELDVFFQQQTSLSVITTTSEGWVVLCSHNNNVRLDMIANVLGEEVHSKDILAESDIPFKQGPKALIALNPENKDDGSAMMQVDPNSPFYLITEEGTTRLHKTSFQWKEEYLFKYEMGDMSSPKPSHITAAAAYRMVVTDNGIHTSDFRMGPTGLFGSAGNYVRDDNNQKQPIHVAPYVGASITNGMQFVPIFMVYDMDNKRFAYYPTDLYLQLTGQVQHSGCIPMSDMEAGGDAFSFPTGQDFVYMENSGRVWSYTMFGTPNSVTYTILKSDGVYHLYGISLNDYYMALMGMPAYTKTNYCNLSNCIGITSAKHFAFSPINNQMFYAVDNKVYRVDLDSSNPSADLQFEVPGEITCLKFHLFRNEENAHRSYDLIVGLDKGGDEGGEVRIYDALDNLAQITTHKELYSGFAKVVDVIYKEPIN